jgi:hypothetical protein
MPFDRTERAFHRWQSQNLFLEAKGIMEGSEIGFRNAFKNTWIELYGPKNDEHP